jgi:hypothetical protein
MITFVDCVKWCQFLMTICCLMNFECLVHFDVFTKGVVCFADWCHSVQIDTVGFIKTESVSYFQNEHDNQST